MEDFLMNVIELGALGIFSLLLLTKGLSGLNELAKSVNELSVSQKVLSETVSKLAETVTRLAEKMNDVDNRVDRFERELRDIKDTVGKLSLQLEHFISLKSGKSKKVVE